MRLFIKSVKIILLTGLVLCGTDQVFAQETDSLSAAATDSLVSSAKIREITGPRASITVLDAFTGQPLSGVSLVIPGFAAAITNEKGLAKLSVPNFNAVINVSMTGFQFKEIYLKGNEKVVVKLHEAAFNTIYSPVTQASGTLSRAANSFAVSSINLNDNWRINSKETPDTYLQGHISGLNAVRHSGTPSIGANLIVRGGNSFYTTNQPLVVVDGMIYNNETVGSLFSGFSNNPLENIDLKDIEQISLVKDAGAALYGTKGANGVLFITTRRPLAENTKIDFSSFGGVNSAVNILPVLTEDTYRSYLGALLQTTGRNDAEIFANPYMRGLAGNLDYYKYNTNNTNWQKEILNTSYNQNYHLNVSGGDNIAKYNLSLGYLTNGGAIRNTNLSRYATRFNANFNFTKKFYATTNLSFASSEHLLANQGQAYKTSSIYLGLIKAPFLNPKDIGMNDEESPNYADSDIFGISNPVALVEKMDAINTSYRVAASMGFHYKFNSKIAASTLLGITYDKVRDRLFIPSRGVALDTLQKGIANNTLGSNTSRLFALFNDSKISYQQSFGIDHKISALIGTRFKEDKYETDRGLTYNSSTDEYKSLGNGSAALRTIGGSLGEMRWLNTYAGLNYSFRNKYFLTGNLAVDGSSRFGKTASGGLNINGNNLAVMPSVGAAWLLSSERFLAGQTAIEQLKLRASFGLVGNDDIGNYSSQSYYVSQKLYGLLGYGPGNVANTDLKWETIKKLNLGLDASLFNERFNLSVDVYQNNGKDLLIFDALNPITGFDYSVANTGGIRTNGVDISINSRILNKGIKWDLGLTLSKYKSEVTSLHDGSFETEFGGATILTQRGQPVNVFYGYKTNGIYSSTAEAAASGLSNRLPDESIIALQGGDVRFVNMNGDAFIDGDDRVVIGDPNPDFTGMFSNNLNYRSWSFDAMFTFSYGNDIYNGTRNALESMSGYQNQLSSVTNRWRMDGQVTDVPRAAFGDPAMNSRFSDRWIEDGSYLRLRSVSLAYNFKIKSEFFKTLRVYANAQNVVTFSKYLGYDPEFSASRTVFHQGVDVGLEPQFRTVSFGVKVGL